MSSSLKESPLPSACSNGSSSTLYKTPNLAENTYKLSPGSRSPIRDSAIRASHFPVLGAFEDPHRLWEALKHLSTTGVNSGPKETPLELRPRVLTNTTPGRLLDCIYDLNGLLLRPIECTKLRDIELELNLNELTINNLFTLVEMVYGLLNEISQHNQHLRIYQARKNLLIDMMLEELNSSGLLEKPPSTSASEFSIT